MTNSSRSWIITKLQSEPALGEHVPKHARAVGHDPVDAEVEQRVHGRRVVDRPHVDVKARTVGRTHEAARRRSGSRRPGSGPGRRWRPAAASGPESAATRATVTAAGPIDVEARPRPSARMRAEAQVGERPEAHAVPHAQPLDERDQRLDGRVVLRVDVHPGVRPAEQQLLEPRDAHAAAAEREAAPAVRREVEAGVRRLDLGDRQGGDRARPVGDAVQRAGRGRPRRRRPASRAHRSRGGGIRAPRRRRTPPACSRAPPPPRRGARSRPASPSRGTGEAGGLDD